MKLSPRRGAALALVLAALTAACATRRPAFGPAGADESRQALSAWQAALARADSQGPVRLLYDVKMSDGLLKLPGTLAVESLPGKVEATMTGPFGSPIARYASGVLEAKGARPLPLEPEELLSLLAGVWRTAPQVAGARAGETLLRFAGREPVEGVLDLAGSRLASLRIERAGADLFAVFSGTLDPWPERISVEDRRSRRRLELALVAREPVEPAPPANP
ncbi:MAG TPA: hypothetical protein VFF17_12490 [Thermoanaerobaculia bacterium]|nr:hypothetical protein [Thermoanaerobaculia bacterium]